MATATDGRRTDRHLSRGQEQRRGLVQPLVRRVVGRLALLYRWNGLMFDQIEKLKQEYTDKYVIVDASQPELARSPRNLMVR